MEHIDKDYSDLEYQEYLFFNNLEESKWVIETNTKGVETVPCEKKEIKFIEALYKLASKDLKNFINNNNNYE